MIFHGVTCHIVWNAVHSVVETGNDILIHSEKGGSAGFIEFGLTVQTAVYT